MKLRFASGNRWVQLQRELQGKTDPCWIRLEFLKACCQPVFVPHSAFLRKPTTLSELVFLFRFMDTNFSSFVEFHIWTKSTKNHDNL